MKKVNPQRKLNLSWMIFFSSHNAFAQRKAERRDVFAVTPTCFNCVTPQCFSQECPYSTELFSFSFKAFREKEKNSVLWRRTCESLCCSPGTSRGLFIYNNAMLRQISIVQKAKGVLKARTTV